MDPKNRYASLEETGIYRGARSYVKRASRVGGCSEKNGANTFYPGSLTLTVDEDGHR